MAITRFFGCNAVVAVALCGAVSSCSSVQTASKTDAAKPADVATAENAGTAPSATTLASASDHAAPKAGRVTSDAALPATAAAVAPPSGQQIQAQQIQAQQPQAQQVADASLVAQKSARLAAPVIQSTDPMQRAAEMAAFTIGQKNQPVAVPALAVASTQTNRNGGLQAINMATAGQTVARPLATPSPLSAPAVAQAQQAQAPYALPVELTDSFVAIPTPRPRIAAATPSSMVAYAAPPQAISAMSADFFPPAPGEPIPTTADASSPTLNKLIKRYAGMYGVPESLVHRVVHRESKYNPGAYNKQGYWGLMQIRYATAKSMGYDGPASGLLDAETNLKYAIKYLRGAWLVAENDTSNAIRLYARGYYFDAKRKDMLHVLK